MIRLNDIQQVYFIGIGGIGMSALARYFLARGAAVSGYDRTRTPLTEELEEAGASIHYEDNPGLLLKEADLVVFTPAVPEDHAELNFYRNNGYTVMKRSEVLGIISSGSFNICVAGTHGKTTISTMIAHLLRDSDYGCNAFLGGISVNYHTNFWSDPRNTCVIEADEYDRSFLRLSPDIAIVSSMDADHLDIYGTLDSLQEAFVEFSRKIKPGGLLLSKFGLKKGSLLTADRQLVYSLQNESADIYALNIRMDKGSYLFDVMLKDGLLQQVRLNMGGMHNVENIVAAIAIAHELGIDHQRIRAAVESFKGVKRRFEYIIKDENRVFIDDYAHHPEELSALITGAKTLFKGKRCTVIFQPHLFSRTRDLAADFARSLDLADNVILLPVYPARELPVEGVSSALIADKMQLPHKRVLTKEGLLKYMQEDFPKELNDEFGEVIITAGAGDIDKLVAPLKQLLTKQ